MIKPSSLSVHSSNAGLLFQHCCVQLFQNLSVHVSNAMLLFRHCCVQLFQGLFNAILSDHPNWPQPGPSCGMDSSEWMGYLKEAHFGKIGITEYAREVLFTMAGLTWFMVGPSSQIAPLLDKLQAAGRPNIHQEAPQVCLLLLFQCLHKTHTKSHVTSPDLAVRLWGALQKF